MRQRTVREGSRAAESHVVAAMSDGEEEDSFVNAEWLETVLASYHGLPPETESNITVVDYTVRPGCDDSENVLSDILAVTTKYQMESESQPLHLNLIVKLLPNDPFSRFFVTEAQFDLREIKFYTQVVPDLLAFQKRHLDEKDIVELPIPKCYHACYQEGCESVLVLENLKTRGFSGAEFSQGLTRAQTEAALVAVARFHALSLAMKVVEGIELSGQYPFLFQTARATDSYQHLVERGLPQLARFLELRPGYESVLERLRAIKPTTKELIAELLAPEEPIALITHTDFWCNNLLFQEDKCAILDWQMVTYSRPTNDVALLLVSSVPTELRRENTDELLEKYWNELTGTSHRLGVDVEAQLGYNLEQFRKDYKKSQLLALLLCIGSVDVALGDPLTEQRLLDLLTDLHQDGILQPPCA